MLNEDGAHGVICSLELSQTGCWLATGTADGRCVIWDLLTSSAIATIGPPVPEERQLSAQAFAWSYERKSLLVAYSGGLVVEWGLPEVSKRAVYQGQHPLLLAAFLKDGSWLLVDEAAARVVSDGGTPLREHVFAEPATAAAVAAGSSALVVGNGRGEIRVLGLPGLEPLGGATDAGSPVLKLCTHHHGERLLLAVLKDRTIKHYEIGPQADLQMAHRFANTVDKMPWAAAGFSHNGEHMYCAVKAKGHHTICIYRLDNRVLERTLEGPREDLVDMRWHPKRPIMVSLSKYGVCYVWKPQYARMWSALFPGMQQVEENVEYIEREDEFDEVQDRPEPDVLDESEPVDMAHLLPSLAAEDLLDLKFFHRRAGQS